MGFFAKRINKDRADQIVNHLIDISHGQFSLTDEEISGIDDEKLQEVFFSLKILDEDLRYKNEELKKLDRIKKRTDFLDEHEKMKSNFLSNMSHEIRTPLNGIVGVHNLILEDIKDPTHRKMLTLSLKSTQDLAKIFNDLIEVTRIDKGQFEVHKEVINLSELIKNQISLFTTSASQKEIDIRFFQKEEEDLKLYSDRNKLNQIISNILGNAIKFTSEGSVVVKVKSIISTLSRPCYKVVIQDTGVGIPMEHQELVFNEFHQVSRGLKKNYEGVGLGLSIAKNMVELLGGNIKLTSSVRGTTVMFTLECQGD